MHVYITYTLFTCSARGDTTKLLSATVLDIEIPKVMLFCQPDCEVMTIFSQRYGCTCQASPLCPVLRRIRNDSGVLSGNHPSVTRFMTHDTADYNSERECPCMHAVTIMNNVSVHASVYMVI